MNLRLLAHPARTSHRVDQLDRTGRERGGVGDAFTPLVSHRSHPEATRPKKPLSGRQARPAELARRAYLSAACALTEAWEV